MRFIEEKILNDFDITINKYLVFLVHVQKSTLIQVSDKIAAFDKAKNVSSEIRANVQKTLDNISEYNVEEKRRYISEMLLKIETIIVNEITNSRKIKISDDGLFLLNNIIENLTTEGNGIKMSHADISNIYSYKELNVDKGREKYADKEIQEMKDRLNVGLEEIKKKAFLKILYKKNENPERFYKVNDFILDKCRKEEIKLFVSSMPEDKDEGLFFIINKNDLIIRRKTSNGLIFYVIKFDDFEGQFNINITGKINVNDLEETFNIDETYPNSMKGAVLNTFNIRETIELFNLLYTRFLSRKGESENSNDIDNYLDGKIKND
ncbi:MAG: hypothetical protein LBK13_11740 [Spirochaetales bacterium]|jgi:hypothetical protein|nr:hypothetical protein [Spirochaetales bacterium]